MKKNSRNFQKIKFPKINKHGVYKTLLIALIVLIMSLQSTIITLHPSYSINGLCKKDAYCAYYAYYYFTIKTRQIFSGVCVLKHCLLRLS
jgi:hypothetical protein